MASGTDVVIDGAVTAVPASVAVEAAAVSTGWVVSTPL